MGIAVVHHRLLQIREQTVPETPRCGAHGAVAALQVSWSTAPGCRPPAQPVVRALHLCNPCTSSSHLWSTPHSQCPLHPAVHPNLLFQLSGLNSRAVVGVETGGGAGGGELEKVHFQNLKDFCTLASLKSKEIEGGQITGTGSKPPQGSRARQNKTWLRARSSSMRSGCSLCCKRHTRRYRRACSGAHRGDHIT